MAPQRGYGQKDEGRLKRSPLPLSGTGGSHGSVYQSDKQKKDGTYTRYIHIFKADKDPPFVADYSAITSELLRFVSTDVFPKVRVITRKDSHAGERESIGYLSSEIQGYQTANDLIANDFAKFNSLFTDSDKKRQLAALFVGAYFTAENDLHGGNWGIDAHGNIKKIDNDQALFHHTAGYKRLSGAYINDLTFTQFPNMIFPREKAFNLTAHDIEKLPILDFAKPANWPSADMKMLGHLTTLSQDPEFKKYKWQYFTKLLLVSDRQLQDICKAHTLDIVKTHDLYFELQARKVELRKVLLNCSEYREFLMLMRNDDETFNFLNSALESYDDQFEAQYKIIDSTGAVIAEPGDIKPKYLERIFFHEEASKKELADVLESLISDAEKITHKDEILARSSELAEARELHLQAYDLLVGDTIDKESSLEVLRDFIRRPSSQLQKQVSEHLDARYSTIAINYYTKMYDKKYNQLSLEVNAGKLASDTDIKKIALQYAQAKYEGFSKVMLHRYVDLAGQIRDINAKRQSYLEQCKSFKEGEESKVSDSAVIAQQTNPVRQVATRQFQAASSAPSSTAYPTHTQSMSTPPTKVRSEPDAQTKDNPIPPRGSSPKGRS